jgi:hypothetical protein
MFGVSPAQLKASSQPAPSIVATRQAHARLVAAFAEELAILKTSTETEIGSAAALLHASYQKHLRAYIELRAVLCGKERSAIEEKWKAYTQEDQNLDPIEREKFKFIYLTHPDRSESDTRLLAIKHIELLIQCA